MTKALGMFVFAGSATIGVMNNGVKPTQILEMVDGMDEANGMHFVKNYPEIPMVKPSEWENEEYLKGLREEEYDLLYGNPPCSGLSLARIGASADNEVNCHMYRYFDTVQAVQPKTFILENAPTLLTIGKPILTKAMEQLKDDYRFLVIRDFGKNHGVAMGRQRTFFIGFHKDHFDKVPTLHMDKQAPTSIKDVIGDLYNKAAGNPDVLNHTLVQKGRPDATFDRFLKDLPKGMKKRQTIRWTICNDIEKYRPELTEKELKSLKTQLWKQAEGLGYWDKSPHRPSEDGLAPSLTGYTSIVHPEYNRHFTIREYARLMGYPDDFEFLVDDQSVIIHIAQGVPAKFFEYISKEVIEATKGNRDSIQEHGDTEVVFQHHGKAKHVEFTLDEWKEAGKVDEVKEKKKELDK